MRKILFILLFFVIFFWLKPQAYSQFRYPVGKLDTTVSASVGELYLSISGFASPYASIILTSDQGLLRTTVADEYGNFYISQVLIKKGFSHFCLTTIDFKRIGESLACMDITPATDSVVLKDIFLPPTIGLVKKQIVEGEEAVVMGYTMPFATVTISIGNGQTITVTADATGFYTYRIKNLKAGKYSLFADATYNKIKSLPPQKPALLEAISRSQQILETGKNALQNLWELLITSGIAFILLILILLFLITFLLIKLRPQWFPAFFDKFKRKNKMHHDWLLEIEAKNKTI